MPRRSLHDRRYNKIIRAISQSPWVILPEKLEQICELINLRADGYRFTADEIQQRIGEDRDGERELMTMVDGIAVLHLHGVLSPRMDMLVKISGGTSTEAFSEAFRRAMANDSVRHVVLDVDSPGGAAAGVHEVGDLVYQARGQKPITGVARNICASGAYWIFSAADELVGSPSSEIGSIGAFAVHTEFTEADKRNGVTSTVIRQPESKGRPNEFEKLDSGARSILQSRIDDTTEQFESAVARNRGISVAEVRERYGAGRVFLAPAALERGLIDRIGTLQDTIAAIRGEGRSSSSGFTRVSFLPIARIKMERKIRQQLEALGLVEPNAADDVCQASLRGFFGARGRAVPSGAQAIVIALREETKPTCEEEKPDCGTKATCKEDETRCHDKPHVELDPRKIAAEENDRINAIRACGETMGIDAADIEAACKDIDMSFAKAAKQFTEKASKDRPPIKPVASEHDNFLTVFGAVLEHRLGALSEADMPAGAHQHRYERLTDLGKMFMRQSGHRASDDPETIAAHMLSGGETVYMAAGGGAHPSDFPNLLSATLGKMMDKEIGLADHSYRQWAARLAPIADFKPKSIHKLGEVGELDHWPDGYEEPKKIKPSEEVAFISVDEYANEFAITRRMIVDDDLGQLPRVAARLARAADATANRLCVNLLVNNEAIYDGTALFTAGHGNDRTSGGAPSQSEFDAMDLLLRQQKDVSNKQFANLFLQWLLVPNELITVAKQTLSPSVLVVPTSASNTETFRGAVTPIAEPMLSDDSAVKYYGGAWPSMIDSIAYAFQRGYEGGFRLTSRDEPKSEARIWKVKTVVGVTGNNHRGIVRNAGA